MNQVSMKELGIENSRLQKKLDSKFCSVPENMRAECSGGIIKAHTISKCLGLSNLAIDGKVFGSLQKPNLFEYNKNQGRLEIIEMGVQQASVLQCFCSKHDREIFSPIENEDFIVSAEQCFLLAYRAFISEWYKSVVISIPDNIIEKIEQEYNNSLRESEIPDYLNREDIVNNLINIDPYVQGIKYKKRDLDLDKKIFDEILVGKDFSQINHYIFEGGRTSKVVSCFTLNPDLSFDNLQIQDYESDSYMTSIYINSISKRDKSYIIFSWIDTDHNNGVVESFFGGLRERSNDDIENDILEFIFKNSENTFFAKDWYISLNRTQHKYLENWIQPVSNRCLNKMNHKMRFIGLQNHYLLSKQA